jgi:hypothetical protein
MNTPTWISRIVAAFIVCVACLAPSRGVASITPDDDRGHRSALRATVTMTDGTAWAITLQGVGCSIAMCSRVRARDSKANNVWLDGLASVRDISHNASGPIQASLRFKDGTEGHTLIVEDNRVLYIQGRLGRTEKLDLANVTNIDFN